MTTHADFLAAIISHREDDGPRLVYADFLEEQGETARAEFIRVQCELEKRPRCEDELTCPKCLRSRHARGLPQHLVRCKSEYADAVRRRAAELLAEHGREWSEDVAKALGLDGFGTCAGVGAQGQANWAFRHGFVAEIACTAEAWLEHADALLAAAPLEVVRLTTYPEIPLRLRNGVGSGWLTSLPGRPEVPVSALDPRAALAALWPTLRFELPAAEYMGRVVRHVDGLTTFA